MGENPEVSHGWTITSADTNIGDLDITNVTPPNTSVDSVDSSHQGTTTSMTFEPVPLQDNGELSFDAQYDQEYDPPYGVKSVHQLTGPSGAVWTFAAFMTGYDPSADHLSLEEVAVTLKVTGDITISTSGGSSSFVA